MVRDLEDFTYGSWGRMTVQLGEQYLLSAALDKTMPTGSVAAVTLFYDLPRRVVHDEVMFAFKAFMKDAEARGLAWTQVRHSFQGGAAYGHGASAADVVRAVLNDFLDKHEDEGGFVAVPRCKCESITGGTCVKRCLPTVEVVVDGSEKLVACRVQMPLIPSGVRLATGMLSATVREQRVVVHCPKVGDVHLDWDAHAAPLFVALTRVPTVDRVALSRDGHMHDNVFDARSPFEELGARVQEWAQGQGFARLYHCQAVGYDGGLAVAKGSADFDVVHDAQVAAGFFA